MEKIIQDQNSLMVIIFVLVLVLLQITFGYLMKKRRKAFLKYHGSLGVIILLMVILTAVFFPAISIISLLVAAPILFQNIIGFLITKGNKSLRKYHKPLGIGILVLVISIIVFILI